MRRTTIRTTALASAALVMLVAAPSLSAQNLKGSVRSVESMHSHAVQNGFDFYRNAASVSEAHKGGELVRLSDNSDFALHQVSYPFVKEEARLFLERLGAQYRATCGETMVVTGATRPLDMKLKNASDNSVHPTGMAVDLRKPSGNCLKWLRTTLVSLENAGVIEATEERRPPHFHVAVYPKPYSTYVVAQNRSANLAQTRAVAANEFSEPATVNYSVRSGDSLWKIASRYDTNVQTIQEMNPRLRTNTIHPGQVILVPTSAQQKQR